MSTTDEHGNLHDSTGRFDGHIRSEVDDAGAVLSAGAQPLDNPEALADRLRVLRSTQRFVPARAFGQVQAADPEQFWNAGFETAEYAPPQVAYPKMPDDFTPNRTEGRALSGQRRTHRARYQGNQVDLLMPSVTSVRAYANTINGAFDIPVQATDKAGNQITAWVRCSRTPNGRWMTSGLGFGGTDDAIVSEAVASVLEARRPRQALKTVGDLLASRRERVASAGIGMTEVKSSWIGRFGFSEEDGMTVMETLPTDKRPARLYGYRTGRAEYNAAVSAEKPGTVFNQMIRKHPRVELGACPNCAMVYALNHQHTCRSMHHRPEGQFDHKLQRWAGLNGAQDLIAAMNQRNQLVATGAI